MGSEPGGSGNNFKSAFQTRETKNQKNENNNISEGEVGELPEGLHPSMNDGEITTEETTLPILGEFDAVVMGGGHLW